MRDFNRTESLSNGEISINVKRDSEELSSKNIFILRSLR